MKISGSREKEELIKPIPFDMSNYYISYFYASNYSTHNL